MPQDYVPKLNPLSVNRIRKKIAGDLKDGKEDRKAANEYIEQLLEIASYEPKQEEEPRFDRIEVMQARKLILEAMKLSQTAKDKDIKLLDVAVRLEIALGTKPEDSKDKPRKRGKNVSFDDMEEAT